MAHGEYYNDEVKKSDLQGLRDEDNRQNHRLLVLEQLVEKMRGDIQELWNSHGRIEVALIGHDGQNGIRGTMMDHYQTTRERLEGVESGLRNLATDVSSVARSLQTLETTIRAAGKGFGIIGAIIGVVGIIVGIVVAF